MRPGTTIISRATPPPRSSPSDTAVWFVAGIAEKGDADDARTPIRNMSEFNKRFGARLSTSVLYDALDTYFREGGGRAYVSRVVPPAAAAASLVLNSAVATPTATVRAKSAGAWGSALNVQVIAGGAAGTFRLIVTHDTDSSVNEQSPDLADKAAAISWAQSSSLHIDFLDSTPGNAADPQVAAATSLAGGSDGNPITDAEWQTALDAFGFDLGPGQVSAPGQTTAARHAQLLAHAEARSRYALIDLPDTSVVGTLIGAANGDRIATGRYGMPFAPWVNVPALVGTTPRAVPPSALVAGVIARNESRGLTANQPSAGENGQAQYAIGVSQPDWSNAERQSLNEATVNVIRSMFGGVRIYGWRSLVDPVAAPTWLNAGNGRLHMAIVALANAIAERYVFRQIDGTRTVIKEFEGELTAMLVPFYNAGSLYGATPREAFRVDTNSVNTDDTIAAGELHAHIALKMSPYAEEVIIEITKVNPQEALA